MENRLKELRESHSLSQQNIAQILGISQSAYSQIEKGTVSLSVEHLKRLCQQYGVTMDWLSSGTGPKYLPRVGASSIPLVDIAGADDYLKNLGDEDFLARLENYRIPRFTEGPGSYCIFEMDGKSMEPSIMAHDHLICSRVRQSHELLDGSVCVLITAENILVKRVSFGGSSRETLLLSSDNTRFEPITLASDEVREWWLVNANITTSLMSDSFEQRNRISRLENEFIKVKEQLKQMHQAMQPR